jgi:hypothetical protein
VSYKFNKLLLSSKINMKARLNKLHIRNYFLWQNIAMAAIFELVTTLLQIVWRNISGKSDDYI